METVAAKETRMNTVTKIQHDLELLASLIQKFPALPSGTRSELKIFNRNAMIEPLVSIMLPPADEHKELLASRLLGFATQLSSVSGHIVIKFNRGKIEAECAINESVCCSSHAEMIFRCALMALTNSHALYPKTDNKHWQLTLDRMTPMLYHTACALVEANEVTVKTVLRSKGDHA